MPTNFPTSVDNFTNPTANDSLNLPSHSTQHANANDAIEAVEDYLLTGLGKNGLVHISTATYTSTTTINIDNVFSSTYDNYYITFETTASSAAANLFLNLRAGGATTSTNFGYQLVEAAGSGITATQGSTSFIGIVGGTVDSNFIDVSIFKPNLAKNTTYFARVFAVASGITFNEDTKGAQASTTQFDGVQFNSAATMSAKVSVYGYRKS
jgi:hypothetical protein